MLDPGWMVRLAEPLQRVKRWTGTGIESIEKKTSLLRKWCWYGISQLRNRLRLGVGRSGNRLRNRLGGSAAAALTGERRLSLRKLVPEIHPPIPNC